VQEFSDRWRHTSSSSSSSSSSAMTRDASYRAFDLSSGRVGPQLRATALRYGGADA